MASSLLVKQLLFVFVGDSVTLKIIIKILRGVDFVDSLIYRQMVLPDGGVQHFFW